MFGIFGGRKLGTSTSMVLSGTPPHQFCASSHLVSLVPNHTPDLFTVNVTGFEAAGGVQSLLTVTRYLQPFIEVVTPLTGNTSEFEPTFVQVTPAVPLSVCH